MPTPERYTARSGKVTWRVRLRDPKRRRYTSETFVTKAEAERFCKVVALLGPLEALKMRYSEVGAPRDSRPLDEFFEGYIAWKATRVRSDRTIADYHRDYRNHIQPTFGRRPAALIDEADVQDWVERMTGHLSPKSIADRHSLLHGIFKWAMTIKRDDKLEHNPCLTTDLPKRPKRQPKGLRPAEWHALYIALHQISPDAADLALFLASTGWRFSEAAALCTYDVEDYDDALFVSVTRVLRRNAAGQHVIVADAKSEESLRRIRLLDDAATMVRRRLRTIEAGGLIFTTASGAQTHYSNFVNRAWKPAVKAAGIPRNPSPHWLRHSHVYWLDLTGASMPGIQKRIGHAHIETTSGVYGSMISDVSDDALAALNRLIALPALPPGIAAAEGAEGTVLERRASDRH